MKWFLITYILSSIFVIIKTLLEKEKVEKLLKKSESANLQYLEVSFEMSDVLRAATDRPDLGYVCMAKYLAARNRELSAELYKLEA